MLDHPRKLKTHIYLSFSILYSSKNNSLQTFFFRGFEDSAGYPMKIANSGKIHSKKLSKVRFPFYIILKLIKNQFSHPMLKV